MITPTHPQALGPPLVGPVPLRDHLVAARAAAQEEEQDRLRALREVDPGRLAVDRRASRRRGRRRPSRGRPGAACRARGLAQRRDERRRPRSCRGASRAAVVSFRVPPAGQLGPPQRRLREIDDPARRLDHSRRARPAASASGPRQSPARRSSASPAGRRPRRRSNSATRRREPVARARASRGSASLHPGVLADDPLLRLVVHLLPHPARRRRGRRPREQVRGQRAQPEGGPRELRRLVQDGGRLLAASPKKR